MNTWDAHTWGRESPVAAAVNDGLTSFPLAGPSAPARVRRKPSDGVMQPGALQMLDNGTVSESQSLSVIGRPSVNVARRADGATEITMRRNIKAMEQLTPADVAFVESWGEDVLEKLRALSRGPYTQRALRQMGHPYGFDQSPAKGHGRFAGRKVPRRAGGKSLGNVRGVRGSVPTLSVVNAQSGDLSRAWSFEWERDASGFTAKWVNTTPQAWLVAHGTLRMQAHGPFSYAPLSKIRQLESEIGRAIYAARTRAAIERADVQTEQMLLAAAGL